jgi:hypothetical protein
VTTNRLSTQFECKQIAWCLRFGDGRPYQQFPSLADLRRASQCRGATRSWNRDPGRCGGGLWLNKGILGDVIAVIVRSLTLPKKCTIKIVYRSAYDTQGIRRDLSGDFSR